MMLARVASPGVASATSVSPPQIGPELTYTALATTGPAGMTATDDGRLVHVVQPGDTLSKLSRAYQRGFGLTATFRDIHRANIGVLGSDPNIIRPGQVLKIPGLQAAGDTLMNQNPNLIAEYGRLRHDVHRGETLTGIARHYSATTGKHMTWPDLYAANRDLIGPDPNRLMVGWKLEIPGISHDRPTGELRPGTGPGTPPTPTGPFPADVHSLDGVRLLSRYAHGTWEDGSSQDIEVVRFSFDASTAVRIGTDRAAAVRAAQIQYSQHPNQYAPTAVVRDAAGSYWTGQLRGVEQSDNLDDSFHTLSLSYRGFNPAATDVIDRQTQTSL